MSNRFSRILLRGGLREELKAINPMLKQREPIVEYDTGKMKIGDGVNRYNKLRYVGESSVPTIISFAITKCTNTKNETFNDGNVSDDSIIKEVIFKYKISSSPDRIFLYYDATEEVIFSESFPEKLEGEFTLSDIKITSNDDNDDNDDKFILKLETLDGSPTSSVQINFQPYIYYGHASSETINELLTTFNANKCSKKLIRSSENDIKDIVCDNDYIFFFLPKSKYENGAKFQDIDVPIGWGGFVQLDKYGEHISSFKKDEYILINNKPYYIYRSENIISSVRNIRIDKT